MTTTRLLAQLAAIGAGGTSDIPGFAALREFGAITDLTEKWRRDEGEADIVGSFMLDGDITVPVGSLSVAIGTPGGGAAIPISVTVDADLLETILLVLSLRADLIELDGALPVLGHLLDGVDVSDPDLVAATLATALVDAVAALGDIRVSVGPVPARVDLPEEWLRRVHPVIDSDGKVIRLDEVAEDPRAWIPLGQITLGVSSAGVEIDLEDPGAADSLIEVPPVMIADTGVAIMITQTVWHRDGPLPDGLTDHDLPDDWQGLIIGGITVWGLDRLLPGAPSGRVDHEPGAEFAFTDWVIDREGLRGTLTLTTTPDADESQFAVSRVDLEFDRSWWPTEVSLHAALDIGAAMGDETHMIDVVADLRINPTDPMQGWGLELTAQAADRPLITIDRSGLGGIGAAAALLSGLAGDGDPALLAGAIAALEATDLGRVTSLDIDHLGGVVRPALVDTASGTQPARIIELALSASIMLELSLDDPVSVELGTTDVTASIIIGADPVDRSTVSVDWSLAEGLTLALPAVLDIGGLLVIDDISLRRIAEGLVIELAVETSGTGDLAVAGLPDAVTVTYRPTGSPQIDIGVRRGAAPMSLLIPGVLYAAGTLEHEPAPGALFAGDGHTWGDIMRGKLSAFLIGNGTAQAPADHLDKSSYAFDLEIGVLSATRDDGLQAFILTADAGFRPGLPIGPSGASLYGLGLTFAMNGAPSVTDGDYAAWFLEAPPAYSTAAEKWQPEAGGWAFGAAATLGSGPDDGRSWNAGAGLFFLLPGPVILITGEGDLFSTLPSLPAQGGDPEELSFAFGAVITLDFRRRIFAASLRGELEKSAGDATLVRAVIPAEVHVALDDPTDFSLSVGRPEPLADRTQIEVLGLFDASSYLLLSGTDIILPGVEPPLTLPGLALAFGGAGGFDRRLSAGPARVVLWARAGFDVGLSLSLPLAAGRVYVEGGVDVSIYGIGLSLEASLELMAMAPRPFMLTGSVAIRVGLPWPLSDFKASAKLELAPRRTWIDDAPRPEPPAETLTLWGRGTDTPVVIEPGGSGAGVPLDALAQLAFSAPVSNDAPVLGSVMTDGDDSAAPVWQIATTETDDDGFERRHGYRHRINSVMITRRTPDGEVTEHDVPGFWPGGTALGAVDGLSPRVPRASGGMVARTNLRMWGLADPVAARIGGGGDLVARWIDSWNPCEPPRINPKQARRLYTARSLVARLRERAFVPPVLKLPRRLLEPKTTATERIARRVAGHQNREVGTVLARRLVDAADTARTRFAQLPQVTSLDVYRQRIDTVLDVEDTRQPFRVKHPIEQPPKVAAPADRRVRRSVPVPNDSVAEPSLVPLRQVVESRLDLLAAREKHTDEYELMTLAPEGRLPVWWTRQLATAPLPVGETIVLPNETPPDDTVARVRVESLPPGGELVAGLFGAEVEPARLARNPATIDVRLLTPVAAGDPVFALPRLIVPEKLGRLSSVFGELATETVGRLRIDLTDTERATAIILAAPNVHIAAWQSGPDGTEQPLDTTSEMAVDIGERRAWRRVRIISSGPVIALSFAAVHGPLTVGPDEEPAVAVLTSIETVPHMKDHEGAHDRHRHSTDTAVRILRDAAETWDGTGSPAGILNPGATYEVTVSGTSNAVTEGRAGLETGAASYEWERSFTFTTTDQLSGSLRAYPGEAPHNGRVAAEGSRDSDWDVATSPGDGARAHYTGVPLLLRLRDARTVAVSDALGYELRLRLIDEQGTVTEHLGGIGTAEASDLDRHLVELKNRLAEFPCVADGRGGEYWREARIALPELLAPRTRYIAHLEAVPRGGGEPVAMHEWRFRTSAYANAADHLAAHVPVDEIVPDDGRRAAVGNSAPGGLHIDDAAFDEWLVDRLGVPVKAAPTACELVRIWAWDPAAGTAVCTGLLLDGDESLLRDSAQDLLSGRVPAVLRHRGKDVPITVVTGVSKARLLVVPSAPLRAGDFELALRSRGSTARLTVQIPDLPDNLNGDL